MTIWKIAKKTVFILIAMLLLCNSVGYPPDLTSRVRYYTHPYEFNYFDWTVNALVLKLGDSGVNVSSHLPEWVQHNVVVHYFDLSSKLDSVELSIQQIYSDPSVTDPESAATEEIRKRSEIQSMLDQIAPTVEDILQNQVKTVLAEAGLDAGGQTLPPVLYHTTPVPKALVVSPRSTIRQEENISLLSDLSLDQITKLESDVETNLDVSALVVDIGGVGMYPTMVMRSSNLQWVIQTIAHEWTHNYLTLHPLGLNYDTNNELRTMNETTAAIVGEEIGREVIDRYYPEYSSSGTASKHSAMPASIQNQETFDFNHEMHITRVNVDFLLKNGFVSEAEFYMEARRKVFLEHGYLIRKLNQAYFAFYGAYAETPQGASGADPVGPAVRALREKSGSLENFLKQIAWMSSFTQLQAATDQ